MEPDGVVTPIEVMLKERATRLKRPFAGSMELLPLCNMRCDMCYVRRDEAELLSAREWLEIGRSAKNAGVLMLLLTGGEPLLHPDFEEIYLGLQKMGFVLTLNTNGTLLDKGWADFFSANPCRKINISLYGESEETYRELCHYPEGFDRTLGALDLLKAREIACEIHITLTKKNRGELGGMLEIAENLGIRADAAVYEFPPLRGGDWGDFEDSRMSPEEAAESYIEEKFRGLSENEKCREAEVFFDRLTGSFDPPPYKTGFDCAAGRSGFWVNWRGELSACGIIPEPVVDLRKLSFRDAWQNIVKKGEEIETGRKCHACRKRFFCPSCAAAIYTECDGEEGAPEYLCRYTDKVVKIMFDVLRDGKKEEQREALRSCGLVCDF